MSDRTYGCDDCKALYEDAERQVFQCAHGEGDDRVILYRYWHPNMEDRATHTIIGQGAGWKGALTIGDYNEAIESFNAQAELINATRFIHDHQR